MNLKRLVSLVLVFLFMGVIAQAQQTFYVNNQAGNDGWPGSLAEPKLTVGSAIIGAPPGSIISVAFTGDNYTEGNITINKALTFTSTGGGTPVFVNAGIDVQVNTAFTGPFQFTNLTLTAGAVTGASNLTFSGNVTRTAGTVDSQINFTAGAHNFTYNGGAAITSGFELPAAGNTTNFGNLTTVGGGTVLTLNESKTMNGVLTTAAALNLGSNTLTIVGGSGAHAVAGNVTNGTLAFSLTGAATITGAVTLPNVTANKTTAGVAAVNLTNITAVSSLVTMGNASANVTHAVTIGTLGSAANNLVNSGNGIINITTAAPVVVHGNVLLNATGLDANAEGQILFAQGGALTVNGNITNQAGVTIGNNNALNAGNAGLIRFADQVTIVNGNVVNNAVLSGTLGVATDATLNGNITFLNAATNLTVTGQISNTSSTSSAFAGLPLNYNTSANINMAALTTGILRADGGINNQADFGGVTNAANINNGNINIGGGARAGASTVGTALNRIGAIMVNSVSNVSGNNGNITIAGNGTTSGFFGTSVTVSGGTGGLLTFANENFNLSGSITNSKTTAGAAAVSVGVGAGLAGATFTVGGSILNQAASNVVVPLSVGGAVAITGSINNSGAGTVNFSNLTTANVTVTGGLTSSGAGGTITFPAITNGVVNVNNINLSAGTINFAATHNAAFNVNGPWTVSGGTLNIQGTGAVAVNVSQTVTSTITWTSGTINFTGRNNINIGSVNTYIGGTGVNPTFTSAGTTLRFIEPLPNVVQNIYVGISSPVYPGPLTIDNDGNIPVPVVRVLPNGGALANLYVLNDVLFDTDVVLNSILLDGVRLNVGKNGLGGGDGDFDNTSGYTTANGGLVMMSGTAALQTVNGNFAPTAGATFGDFGVDNERDAGVPDGVADVVFAAASVFTGDFFLAEGEVDLANTLFNGSAPNWPTVFRTEGLFVTTAPIIAPGTRISVTYYGFDKVTALEIPAGATALHNLTVSTTHGAQAGFGIVSMGGAATVNGTLTIDANQSLYTGANALTLAGATAVVNGYLVDDGGVRVQLAAPTGTVFSGTGILPSIQVNAGSVGNNLAGAGLVSNGFGADGVWGGAGVNADDFNTKDGNITYAGGAASSLMATFSAPVAPSTTNFLNLTTAAGATFTLGANAIMGGNMAHVAGNIDLGGFTLDHRGTAPGITVGATTVNGLLYFQTAATNLTVNGPGTAVIGANFQYTDVVDGNGPQTFTFLSASTGNLQITGDITLSDATVAGGGDGALLDIGAGQTLTAAGANVTVGAGCGFTATNLGTTGILDLDVAAPNTLLTWNTPANSSVTNLTVNDDVALSGGIAGSTLIIGNGAPGAFVHNAGNLDIGTANLQIGDGTAPNPTNFNRTGATATYSGSGYMVWNSTGAFNHSTVVAAGAMTINKLRTLLNLALVNPRGLVVVQNLDILNSSVFTNSVAGVGYLTVGDATNVPVISLGEINATDPNIATNAPTFGNAEVDYIFTDAAGVLADGYTVTTTVWPTAQPARNVTVNMAANVNNVTLAANRNITTALNLTQGGLVWDSPVNVTLDADLVITRNAGGFINNDFVAGAPVGTLTAPSVDLVYTNAVGNTGPEYSLPVIVNNVTLGLPAGTAVSIASSRTIAGTITWNSTLTFNTGTTTNVTLAQILPALSTVNVNGPAGIVNWNGGLTVNGTYTNNGTTTGTLDGTGAITNNGTMNLSGLNQTAGTFTMGAASTLNMTGDATLNNTTVPIVPAVATINTANNLAFTGTLTNAGLNVNFTGTNNQTVALGANRTINNLNMVKGNDGTVSVSGGNLTLQAGAAGPPVVPAGVLTLTRGILEMVNPSMLTLNLTVAGGIITNLGYVRNLAQATHYSHVVGKLGVAIPAGTIGRTEWPVGSINPNYRPAAITFTAGNATIAPTTIIVSHVDVEPTGVKNLPLDGGVKFTDPNEVNMIGGKAPYHWSFEATTSLGAAQMMNVELNGTNLSRPLDNHNDLRIIRRFDGDVAVNGWFLEGDPANYSNAMYVNTPAPGDTLLLVRNIGSAGSAIAQRALFTIGIPTQPPVFTAKGSDDPLANRTINENDTYTFTYQANDLDANPQAIVYSVQGVTPAVPDTEYSIDSVTGDFEFTPSFDLVLAGDEDFTFIVQAMKDGDSTFVTDQLVINVTHVNRAPSIDSLLADTTNVQILNEFAHEFVSSDPDAGQTLTWALTVDPTGGAATINPATGMFSWTPDTADAGNDYTFTVTVTDDDAAPLADATTFTLSVGYDRVKGDINGDGNVDLLDALLALDAAIEKIVLSGLEHWAGDMDDDGDVTLLDALAILDVWTGGPMAASGGKPTSNILSKIQSYNAIASFGKLDVDQESRVIHLPVNLSNVEGIRAFGFDVELSMEVESITPLFNMPSEWLTASNYKDGKLMIGAIGLEDLASDLVLTLEIVLKDKKDKVSLSGIAKINGKDQVLNQVTVQEIPNRFDLSQNYPNPFNPSTIIKYDLAENVNVTMKIYNIAGQEVATIVSGFQEAGSYQVRWDGTNNFGSKVAAGLYIYRLEAGPFTSVKKMMLIK